MLRKDLEAKLDQALVSVSTERHSENFIIYVAVLKRN